MSLVKSIAPLRGAPKKKKKKKKKKREKENAKYILGIYHGCEG